MAPGAASRRDGGAAHPRPLRRALSLLIGVILALAAWLALVLIAVRAGTSEAPGASMRWLLLVGATAAAVAVLLALIAMTRAMLGAVGLLPDNRGKRARR